MKKICNLIGAQLAERHYTPDLTRSPYHSLLCRRGLVLETRLASVEAHSTYKKYCLTLPSKLAGMLVSMMQLQQHGIFQSWRSNNSFNQLTTKFYSLEATLCHNVLKHTNWGELEQAPYVCVCIFVSNSVMHTLNPNDHYKTKLWAIVSMKF